MLTVLTDNMWFVEGIRAQLNIEGISILKKHNIHHQATLLCCLRAKTLIIDLSHSGINLQDTLICIRACLAACINVHIMVVLHEKERIICDTLTHYFPAIQILSPEAFLTIKSLLGLKTYYSRSENNNLRAETVSLALTQREIEMLHFLSKGYSQKTIGFITALNMKTVSHYKRSIYRKAGCTSLTDFLALTRRMGYSSH